ncbi:MAG: PAS domain S-box protein [Geobacteraceae bacterium]|nr:PAS domain S-box protein [Geobacteraceae bacterium]
MLEKQSTLSAQLKIAVQELLACEERWRNIISMSPHGVLIVDTRGSIRFANQAATAIFGCRSEDLLGEHFKIPAVTGKPTELSLKSRDGRTVAVEVWRIETEWDGKPAWFVALHDTTERKRGEQELRKLYRAITESPSIVMITDARGAIEYVNPKFTNVTGYTAEEVIGKNPRFLKSGKMPPKLYEELWNTILAGREWRGEMINRKKNGEFYWEYAAISPIKDIEGNITHFVAVTEDITERKRAEEALRFSEARYRALYRDNPTMIVTLDAELAMLSVNPTCASQLGYAVDELEGQPVLKLFHEDDRTAVAEQLRTCLRNPNQVHRWQFRKTRKDGGLLWVEELAQAVYDLNGALNILVVCQDITARKRVEEEIETLNTTLAARAFELETVNLELEAFNYTVSHDLRKPLTIINGYCQAIMELCGDKLDQQCKDYLRETYDGTLRMNQLIDTLLNFSRLAHCEIKPETVDLSAMAREITAALRVAEPQRRVTFAIAEEVTADGDPALLRVVLENLLGNAWKYTGKREEAVIEFGVTEIDGKPACFVRDNGAGFDMAYADKLFAPFQRLPGTDEFRGHGIGLATVERIIRHHGGKVWTEGEPGKGAIFRFTLPAEGNKP